MMTQLRARDIMVTNLITVREDMDLHDVARLLVKHKISGAPVVNDGKQLIGVLTEKDLMTALIDAAYDDLPSTKVGAYMHRNPHAIEEDLDVLSIAQIFQTRTYRRLPVVSEGQLVGQISRRDVLRAVNKLIEPAQDHSTAILYLSALRDPTELPFD